MTVQLLIEEMRSLREELTEVATLVSTQLTSRLSDDRSVKNFSTDLTMMTKESQNPLGDATLWWLCVVVSFVCVWASLSSSFRLFLIMEGMGMPKLQVTH